MVSVSSAIRVDARQQERMNQIVIQDVKRRILQLKNEQILPMSREIAELKNTGVFQAQEILNKAQADQIRIVAGAEKKRRKMFIDLIGKDHYVNFETMMNMVRNLDVGNTRLTIVPDNSRIFLGESFFGAEDSMSKRKRRTK